MNMQSSETSNSLATAVADTTALPYATPPTAEKSPWTSINDMLIKNKCWLCQSPFPRGKPKKVFQVSQLLSFYKKHAQMMATKSNVEVAQHVEAQPGIVDLSVEGGKGDGYEGEAFENTIVDSETAVTNGSFISQNLQRCYESYVELIPPVPSSSGEMGNGEEENPDKLFAVFRENDVETWMSGLVCGMSADCKKELAYFIEPKGKIKGATSTASKAKNTTAGLFTFVSNNNPNCPPGCGCDNPWGFLSK
mmetsp:Transcript_20655/g.35106  ORF Transcript_20655/g.35106 Transcript_20655/m.35106 type:complete len:250 (+) Transcript_20655:79-828(+)